MGVNIPTAANAPTLAATPRRPFYRLHASTWLLLTPFVLLLVVLIAPGLYREDDWPGIGCDHGWPWLFLQREIVTKATATAATDEAFATKTRAVPPGTPGADLLNKQLANFFVPVPLEEPGYWPDWLTGGAWWGPDEARVWSPASLAADVAVALLIVAGAATILEWRRRRRARVWQFSLVELGCVVALVAGALGWWRANAQAAEVEAPLQRTKILLLTSYVGPQWLRHFIPSAYLESFDRVTAARFDSWTYANPPHELMGFKRLKSLKVGLVYEAESLAKCLERLPAIEEFEACPVQLSGIDMLCRTGKLTSFDLCGWLTLNVSDTDLDSLRHSPRLQKLNLAKSIVTDEGMKTLARQSNLRDLILMRTKITDVGVARLTALKKLESLNLSQTVITDEGLRAIAQMRRLQQLELEGDMHITRAGLASLATMPKLRVLSVANTSLNEQDLATLQTSSSLRELRVTDGQLSSQALATLQQSWPQCRIVTP